VVFAADTQSAPINDFSEYDAVILKSTARLDHTFTIQMSKETISQHMKFLTQKGIEDYGTKTITYNPASETVATVKGTVTLPDGKTVDISRDDIFEKDVIDKGRRRRAEIKVAFPALEPGAEVEITYTRSYEGTRSVSAWPFQSELFTAESEVTFIPWPSRPWGYTISNSDIRPEVTETRPGGNKAYTVQRTNIPALPREDHTMGYDGLREMIRFYYVDSDSGHDEYWSRGVTRIFKDDIRPLMKKCGDAKDVVEDTLTDASMSSEEKIVALYDYVTTRHPPIGLLTKKEMEDVDQSYRKKLYKADRSRELFDFKYLTQWQTNYLLASLIRSACPSAKVDLVLYVPWDEDKFDPHLKSLRQFDDRMLRVRCDGKTYWLAPGRRYMPAGMTDWAVKGVQVLALNEDGAEFVKIPLDKPDDNPSESTATVTFDPDEGVAVLKGRTAFNPYESYDLRCVFHYFTETEQRDLLERRARDRYGDEAELISFSVENLDTVSEPLIVESEFKIPYEFEEIGDQILMDFPGFERPKTNPFLTETRENPIFFQYPYISDQEITYILPEGYTITSCPDPVRIDDGITVYKVDYTRLSDRELCLTSKSILKGNMMRKEAAGLLRKTYNEILSCGRKKLVLAEVSAE